MKNRGFLLIVAAAVFFLFGHLLTRQAGQKEKPWELAEVAGHLPDLQLALTDDNGKQVTEADYRGSIALLYFGFTQCPDLCPVAMRRLSGILRTMGPDADAIRILFVTVDPDHDTPAVLHRYLRSVDASHLVGLTGPQNAIKNLTRRYRAAYQAGGDGSAAMHSDTVYIFDAAGHARLIATDGDTDAHIASSLQRLVRDRP